MQMELLHLLAWQPPHQKESRKFWSQLVRGLMRKSDQASFEVTTSEIGDRLELAIDAYRRRHRRFGGLD